MSLHTGTTPVASYRRSLRPYTQVVLNQIWYEKIGSITIKVTDGWTDAMLVFSATGRVTGHGQHESQSELVKFVLLRHIKLPLQQRRIAAFPVQPWYNRLPDCFRWRQRLCLPRQAPVLLLLPGRPSSDDLQLPSILSLTISDIRHGRHAQRKTVWYRTDQQYCCCQCALRSLERIVVLLPCCSSVGPSVCLSGTGVHCGHTVQVKADLSLWLDSSMFWAPWHQCMLTYA